jgi:hypothetical protein
MTWIKTVRMSEADDNLMRTLEAQRKLYPIEYATPVESLMDHQTEGAAIIMAHSLLPETLGHAFATFGTLMSPDLSLSRREHEMIAATVSALNDCFY